ncbi:MAG: hypothetical protein U9N84_09115 [Actinomycetota bacterium]|nr:hypothetical protein [Actinomycetota bacterium]
MRNQVLRTLTLASVVGFVFVSSIQTAGADVLEDYLEQAGEATFAGRQATWCSYGGHTEFSTVSVEHAGALVMVENAGYSEMVGGGRYSVVGGAGDGIALSGWSSTSPTGRYVTASAVPETRFDRDVMVVTVDEDDEVRARIWFDQETGAALGSEIYDDDGELFRLSWMLNFDPNPRKIYTMMGDNGSTYDVVVSADAGSLVDTVAGYVRVDAYAGPDESLHAFYTDGLFSFSIFLIDGRVASGPFADGDVMTVDGADYRWILTPSDLWVQWNADGLTYVLVGDLPPDHLEQVLTEMPSPSDGNILSRLWRGIFG